MVGAFAVNFLWRGSGHVEYAEVEAGQLALSAVAIGVLAVSGWLGGKLAYRYGVRVADEVAQTAGYC